MRTAIPFAALVAGALAAACVDNEVTFYIEHIKVPPEPPNCSVTPGDDADPAGLMDLSIASEYLAYYLVTNAAMERGENQNLRAETDGVFVEGAEVYVRGLEGGIVGGSEYYLFNQFIGPETSGIIPAIVVPAEVIATMAEEYGCRSINSYTVAEVEEALVGGAGGWPPDVEYYGGVYAVVRFIGHTQGGSEVLTQEHSFLIKLCCNCLTNWSNCTTMCGTFCEEPDDFSTCTPGIADKSGELVDCRRYSAGATTEWDVADGGTMECDDCVEE